jgi:hypothetical protein
LGWRIGNYVGLGRRYHLDACRGGCRYRWLGRLRRIVEVDQPRQLVSLDGA